MMKPALYSLIPLCLAFAGCETTQPDRFAKADTDRDAKLSNDELNSYLVTGVFATRDANHDNKMTRAEWIVGQDAAQEKQFRDRDANRDGVVTLDEALAYGRTKGSAPKVLREADKNHDKGLSRQEVTDYYGSKEGDPR